MTLDIRIKQPADQQDYDIDFSRWLPDDDTITTAVAEVDPAIDPETNPNGLEIVSVQVASPDVKVWTRGGVNNGTYKVTVTASTAGGRIKEVDFKVRVRNF